MWYSPLPQRARQHVEDLERRLVLDAPPPHTAREAQRHIAKVSSFGRARCSPQSGRLSGLSSRPAFGTVYLSGQLYKWHAVLPSCCAFGELCSAQRGLALIWRWGEALWWG
jgi:hypothetical protein